MGCIMPLEKVRITTLTREQKEEMLDAILAGKVACDPLMVDMLMRDLRGARLPNESWFHYFVNEKLGVHGDLRLWRVLGMLAGSVITVGICLFAFTVIKLLR